VVKQVSQRAPAGDRRPAFGVLPHLLVRIAGGSYDAFRALEATRTGRSLAAARSMEARLGALAEALSDDLFEAVGKAGDDALRHDLLALRRSLFNLRPPDPGRVEAALECLPKTAADRLRDYEQARRRLERLRDESVRLYAKESARSGERLRDLARDPLLRRGLAVSSRSLLTAVDRYLLGAGDSVRTSRIRRAELGLTKYLARFHCKTSPLSTLTSVAVVEPEALAGGRPGLTSGAPAQSRVRTNNALAAYLKDRLCGLPAVRRRLPVRVFPACRRGEEAYAVVRSVRNVDLFHRVRRAVAVDAAVDAASRLPGGATWDDLLAGLAAQLAEAGDVRDRLEGFLAELVRGGVLEVRLETPALDGDWESELARELDRLDAGDSTVAAVRRLLDDLRDGRRDFAASGAPGRIRCLATMAAAVLDVQDRLEAAMPAPAEEVRPPRPDLAAERIVYEDHVRDVRAEVDPRQIEELARRLAGLCAALRRSSPIEPVRRRLGADLRRRLGAGGRVALLDLVERLRREAWDGDAPAVVERRHQALWNWGPLLDARGETAVSGSRFALTLAELEAAGSCGAVLPDDGEPRSEGAFVQLLPGRGNQVLRAVVNFWCPGHGKMIGRFLREGEAALAALREENRRLAGERMFAEIRDGSSHAANVHPPLMPYEILAPGGEGRLSPEQRILAADLDVAAAEQPLLVHRPSGRTVVPFDMDFQVESERSRTFRLLRDLSPIEELPLPPLIASLHAAIGGRQDGVVRHLPRIVLDDLLVLGRETWIVPRTELPLQGGSESDGDYFRRLDDWRHAHGLPVRVFVSLLRVVGRPESGADDRSDPAADDRKPQYVSFHDPFLVRLLARLLTRAPGPLVVEEALPAADHMLPLDGEPRVTEWVLQWTA